MAGTSNTPTGLMLPTMKSFTPGAGNQRDSAALSLQNMNTKQATLNATVGGRRKMGRGRRIRYSGGSSSSNNSSITVPQFQMPYTPQGGVGTNPNDQIKATSSTSMQSAAWAANDQLATKLGGTKKRHGKKRANSYSRRRTSKNKKGGNWNPNWSWGCYSGGKMVRRNRSSKKRRM